MKLHDFILTGIAMLLFVATTGASVQLSWEGDDLLAHAETRGVAGYKGCAAGQLESVPAYTFRLMKRSGASGTCSAAVGKWRQIDEQTSENGTLLFENLPDGEYKVQCLVGKAIGCEIDEVPLGYPQRSIVYEQVHSSAVHKGDIAERNDNKTLRSDAENSLLLYPNPTESVLNVEVRTPILQGIVQLVIVDMQGRELYTKNYTLNAQEQNTWQVDTHDFASGIYLLRLVDGEGKSLEGKFSVVGK